MKQAFTVSFTHFVSIGRGFPLCSQEISSIRFIYGIHLLKCLQGAPVAATASFSVIACSAFGAPFMERTLFLSQSINRPTSAMCRPFPRSLIPKVPFVPAAEKVRHNGIVGCDFCFAYSTRSASTTATQPLLST
jgi:hypothetical protein